jgi:signal peptidase II
MFYVKLFLIPEWIPYWGGHHFFPAIFNIADSCVTLGLVGLLIFNKKIFIEKKKDADSKEKQTESQETTV